MAEVNDFIVGRCDVIWERSSVDHMSADKITGLEVANFRTSCHDLARSIRKRYQISFGLQTSASL